MLIVDDDDGFRAILRRHMEKRGFSCMDAATAEAAIALVHEQTFSHAIIDLNLGSGASGLDVLRQLQQQQSQCQSVILTGFASIATAVEATKHGAAQYLPKPATADEIIAAFDDDSPARIPHAPITPERLEWEYIQRMLLENNGNISATARALNMHRRTLQRKLAKRPPR